MTGVQTCALPISGAPADPQPGNDRGTRDVLRSENFALGALLFSPDTGNWAVQNAKYQWTTTSNGDAVSIFYLDAFLPRQFEVVSNIFIDKATAGFLSNGYVVLDYQSSTNFKFAGLDNSRDKVQIGRRTASGWVVLAEVNLKVLDNRTYEVKVSVSGTDVSVFVDGVLMLTYRFDTTLADPADPLSGYADPLTDGYLGVGGKSSTGAAASFLVQVPTPEITLTVTDQFDGSSNLSPGSGRWSVTGGRLDVLAIAPVPAVSLTRFSVAPTARVFLETVVRTSAIAGLAFDATGNLRYKFVAIDATRGDIVVGHYTAAGWVVEQRFAVVGGVDPAIDHTLKVVLDGNVADRKSTRLNSSHIPLSRMPSSA